MKRQLFGVLLLLLVLHSSRACGIDLTQSLDRTQIPYEESATLTVTVEWPGSQAAYLFDRPVQPTLEKLRVQRFATSVSSKSTANGEVTQKTFTFTLIPTGSGLGRIEPMMIHYVSWPDSIPGDLSTSAMSLTIAAAVPVSQQTGVFALLPIWGWIAVWVVLAGGAGTGAFLFVRTRNKPVVELRSPAMDALEALDRLQAEAGGDLKRFQTGLYKMLTGFVHDQFGIEIAGRSVEEVAASVRETSLSESDKERLAGWLLRAEREKFSPLPPAPGETIRLETEVRAFLEDMKSKQ